MTLEAGFVPAFFLGFTQRRKEDCKKTNFAGSLLSIEYLQNQLWKSFFVPLRLIVSWHKLRLLVAQIVHSVLQRLLIGGLKDIHRYGEHLDSLMPSPIVLNGVSGLCCCVSGEWRIKNSK